MSSTGEADLLLMRRKLHQQRLSLFSRRKRAKTTINKTGIGSKLALLWILISLLSLVSLRQNASVCASDDAAQVDDGVYGNVNNDDAAAAAVDDDAAKNSAQGDDNNAGADDNSGSSSSSSSSYENEQKQYQNTDDDTFHWNDNIGFDGVSVMPLSCIN